RACDEPSQGGQTQIAAAQMAVPCTSDMTGVARLFSCPPFLSSLRVRSLPSASGVVRHLRRQAMSSSYTVQYRFLRVCIFTLGRLAALLFGRFSPPACGG